MKKFAILAGLMSLALVIGVAGTSFHPGKAQAKPTDIIAFNPDVCATLLAQHGDSIAPCFALESPTMLAALANDLNGDVGDPDTYADLVNASAAQLGDDSTDGACLTNAAPCIDIDPTAGVFDVRFNSQSMWVLTFVTNDSLLTEDADQGDWLSTIVNPGTLSSSQNLCPFADEDCDANGTSDDGVVVDLLYSGSNTADNTLDRGDAQAVTTQSGVDATLDYTVVGTPDDSSVQAVPKTTIESENTNFDNVPAEFCELPTYTDTAGFNTEVALPDVTGLLDTVTDDDGTDLTGIWVGWITSHDDVVALSEGTDSETFFTTASITSGKVTAAFNLACGQDAGSAKVTGGIIDGPSTAAVVDDDLNSDSKVDITVIGGPSTITLNTPPQITCDGVTGAEVDATVLNADGKPVPVGNQVRFDVVALGAAKPIVATTDANGVAKTTVTPLSGVTAGVTVIASVQAQSISMNDDLKVTRVDTVTDDNLEANTLVSCAPVVPTAAPPAGGGGAVTPPRTGDGGYLP